MVSVVQVILRGSQFLWTLLTTALIGNAIASAFSGNASSVNYAIFVSVFSWIVLLYGMTAAFVERLAMPIVLCAMDLFATIFTFIAGVVLAAELKVHSCNNRGYTLTNHLTNGSHDTEKRCRELQASTAFYWFLFVSFTASLVMDFINRGSSMSMGRRGGGIRSGVPSMSQV
ncbi:putative Non-classical export protein 2 [Tricladium varicosporioides]|nr:putative Non-classical export protein 2 [Hymenoscyphus varicosporioides]